MHAVLELFGPATSTWFSRAFDAPTRVQTEGWPKIACGQHALLLAPTGSGKTLASFLSCIDRIAHAPPPTEKGYRAVYVSPMKALVYDIERNLRAPLVGIEQASALVETATSPVRVDVRTGDTKQDIRAKQKRNPGDLLVTTPESLYLLLTSAARENFRTVQTIIVDEIHTLAATKRGTHLAVSLERLSALCDEEPQRIGLSATQRPLERIARYLGGDRAVEIVDTSEAPHLDLSIRMPKAVTKEEAAAAAFARAPSGSLLGPAGDFALKHNGAPSLPSDNDDPLLSMPASAPDRSGNAAPHQYVALNSSEAGIWPSIHAEVLALIRAHRSTIVFTNSRLQCERLAKKLNELAGEELVSTHHGSLSHARRETIEEALKTGQIPALVATSSLELGIDMGAVDLVICVESPGSVASGLQRVGRAGHQVGARSQGTIFPKYKGDLLEAAVVASRMQRGLVEETKVPRNCLDILSQHIVASVAVDDVTADDLFNLFRRAAPFAELTRPLFEATLDMLSGRYPSDAFAELVPRINYDRETGLLTARKSARIIAVLNGGTIEDRGLYRVHLGEGGPRLGELDEEMVYESRVGDAIVLGSSTWRITDITKERVHVAPAPGEPGRLPFWRGERPGRPLELGQEMGKFLRELDAKPKEERTAFVQDFAPLDDNATAELLAFVDEQKEAAGALPTDRTIIVERFRDELGDWRLCILTPFGMKVHAPWAIALEAILQERAGFEVEVLYTDDGLSLRFPDSEETAESSLLFPDPDEVEARITDALGHTALFAAKFRANAARALLFPRKKPDGRQPLWLQRRRAQGLQAVAMGFPAFPIVLETYRECLQEAFDLEALRSVLTDIRSQKIRVEDIETKDATPFARSLVFQYVASYLYDGDAPLAERKAHALTLDRAMLRELLGGEELRSLLEPAAIEEVEISLQCLPPPLASDDENSNDEDSDGATSNADEISSVIDRRARHADGVHDLLRRLGHLSEEAIALRSQEDPAEWIEELIATRRAIRVRIADEDVYIAIDDAARYRDALGVALPAGVPKAYLDASVGDRSPMESLLLRYARTHVPFTAAAVATAFGFAVGNAQALLDALVLSGQLERGEMTPGREGVEYVFPEVLRRIRRASLAMLRQQVAPVEAEVFARFLLGWQGVAAKTARGLHGDALNARLMEVIEQLEGEGLPWSDLVDNILPARVPGFRPEALDALGAQGAIVWLGRGALGPKDGRVALYQRHRVGLLADAVEDVDDEALDLSADAKRVFAQLQQRGACFFFDIQATLREEAVPLREDDALAALWELVWAGLVTNDTLGPLRQLRAKASKRRGRGHVVAAQGRWSLVADLVRTPATDTEKLHARALALLGRYGIVSREIALAEKLEGGFAQLYPTLRALEDAGKVRRGHFAEGLTGAQFALAGAVDRLRAAREHGEENQVTVLAATDPANAWGAALSWPTGDNEEQSPSNKGRFRRVAGAHVVLVDGRLALFIDKGGKSVVTAHAEESGHPDIEVDDLGTALRHLAKGDVLAKLRVAKIDGEKSLESNLLPRFLDAGFSRGYRDVSAGG